MWSSTMRVELALLSLWLVFSDETESKGYCSFPHFLWGALADGSDRKWLTRTQYLRPSGGAWERQQEVTARRTELALQQKVHAACGGGGSSSTLPCYRRDVVYHVICVSEEPNGKFRVQIQGDGESQFSCIRFEQRSEHVVQVFQAKPIAINEDSLCYDSALHRDVWPWIASGPRPWFPCPLTGGFDFLATRLPHRTELCKDQWRPSRVESECVRGEGIVFFFPQVACNPFTNSKEVRLVCWAAWEEGEFQFLLMGQQTDTPRYVLRLPPAANTYDEFPATLYLSAVTPVTGRPPPDSVTQLQMNVLRSEPGVCYDESGLCAVQAAKGRCTSSGLHEYATYCRRSCGLCDFAPSPSPECSFPKVLRHDWVMFAATSREELSISQGVLRFSTLGAYICKSKHWERDYYKVFSVFTNGCRPRYTCVELSSQGEGQLLNFRMSRSAAADRSFGLCSFHDDPPPLGAAVRSSHAKTLLPISSMFYGSCGVGGMVRAQMTFTDDTTCAGQLWDVNLVTCDPRALIMASFPGCSKHSKQQYLCSAYTRLEEGASLLVTRRDTGTTHGPLFVCWKATEVAGTKTQAPSIVLRRVHCDTREPYTWSMTASPGPLALTVYKDLVESPCGRFVPQRNDDSASLVTEQKVSFDSQHATRQPSKTGSPKPSNAQIGRVNIKTLLQSKHEKHGAYKVGYQQTLEGTTNLTPPTARPGGRTRKHETAEMRPMSSAGRGVSWEGSRDVWHALSLSVTCWCVATLRHVVR